MILVALRDVDSLGSQPIDATESLPRAKQTTGIQSGNDAPGERLSWVIKLPKT